MSTPVLTTKLYIPPPRPNLVQRPHLIAPLNAWTQRKLTLISAPAGFGKTTLLSAWVHGTLMAKEWERAQSSLRTPASVAVRAPHIAWLSLDEADSDPVRFLAHMVAALQTVLPAVGQGVLRALHSAQPPPATTLLTTLLNELAALLTPAAGQRLILVLDDYHVLEGEAVNQALTFLLEYLPPQLHLVISTREDPPLPLARLRARAQLTEVRAADLRFTPAEAADFLNQVMGLRLSSAEVAALDARTEGWIAGLQLAALSLQGQAPQAAASFIHSFSGSHHFVMDYLVEEVLNQQSAAVQRFLLCTSILERFCASLCDAVVGAAPPSGQATLAYLEQANLFLIPLDNERRWYRYHHLFADLLRQRLHQSASTGTDSDPIADYHRRASRWYAANGLEIDAFHHAVAANDVAHAAQLVEGKGMPLHFRGAQLPILKWLATLPPAMMDANPMLWVTYASVLLFAGKNSKIEQKLQAAEAALHHFPSDARHRDLSGHIASIRGFLAIGQNQADEIAAQSQRALDHLHPENLPVRTAATWSLGYAYQLQGNFAAARETHQQALAISRRIGHTIIEIAAGIGLGQIQEAEGQLHAAHATFQSTVHAAGAPPLLVACEAYLGLGRIYYEWHELPAAQKAGEQGMQLAAQVELISTLAGCQVLLARLRLAAGDLAGAADLLANAERFARQHHFGAQLPGIVTAQVLILLRQQQLAAAAQLAQQHNLPLSQAQVALAQGKPAVALALLEPLHRQATATGRRNELLNVLVLQALAHQAQAASQSALEQLHVALTLAEPGGFIRLFVDHGAPMQELLSRLPVAGSKRRAYLDKVLAAFEPTPVVQPAVAANPLSPSLQPSSLALPPLGEPSFVEPLSERELEVLQLIAQGLSNQEIGARLFLALNTVKGHNRRIFAKLQVQRRTEAIAKARALKLLPEQ